MLYEEDVSSGVTESDSEDRNFVRWTATEDLDDGNHCDLEDREVSLQSALETWD